MALGGKWKRSVANTMFLRLKNDGDRTLLRVVDLEGHAVEGGELLTIHNKTGVVRLLHNVSPDLGLKLHTKSGRILVRKKA